MAKTIVIVGFGPGISTSVAKKFGSEGFSVQWNAHGGNEARDLVTADSIIVKSIFDIAIVGLLAAIQEALPDLREAKEGSVLITNGAAGEINPQMDAFVTGANASGLRLMGVAVANAAKDKLVGMLAHRLKGDGIYVGQVTIAGTVKGTAWESPDSIDPSDVADKFWQLHQNRSEVRARIPEQRSVGR